MSAPAQPTPATSVAERVKHEPAANPLASPRTEADYLSRQADTAKDAMSRSLNEFHDHLQHALSLKTIAKDHPIATVAAGALLGFLTASAVVPSKRQVALRRIAELEKALNVPPNEANTSPHVADQESRSFSRTLVHEIFTMVRPVLTSLLTGAIAAYQTPPSPVEEPLKEAPFRDETSPPSDGM